MSMASHKSGSHSSSSTSPKRVLVIKRPLVLAVRPFTLAAPAKLPCPHATSLTQELAGSTLTVTIKGSGFIPGVTFLGLNNACTGTSNGCSPICQEDIRIIAPNDPRIKITPTTIVFTETSNDTGVFSAFVSNSCMSGVLRPESDC